MATEKRKGMVINMIALQIKSIKQIMNSLLVTDIFDHFLTEEISITTFNTFTIDGHIEKAFYTNEEIEEYGENMPEFSSWKDIRPICFSLIKGKKTPVSFRFILHADQELIHKTASDKECDVAENLIRSLVLNVRYENGGVILVTGTSFSTFIPDKSVDRLWDAYIRSFLLANQIDFEEIS